MNSALTRRALLERCAALGTLSLAIPTTLLSVSEAWAAAEKRTPTPACELGPFYKRLAPSVTNLRTANDPGMPLSIAGVVYSVSGECLHEAKLEIWQTDFLGHYDIDGYRFRTLLTPDHDGA